MSNDLNYPIRVTETDTTGLGPYHTGPSTTSAHASGLRERDLNSGSTYAVSGSGYQATGSTHDAANATVQDARATAHNAGQAASQTANDASRQVQQTAHDASRQTQQAAHDVSRQTQQTVNDASRQAQQTASDVKQSAQQTASDVKQSAQQTAQNVNVRAQDAANTASQKASEVSASAKQTAQNAQAQAKTQLNQAGDKLNQASRTANAKLHELGESAAQHPLVQSAQETTNQQLNALDKQLAKFGFLNEFEAKTRIPKVYGVLGFTTTTALLILLNLFGLAQPITNLIGWALPAYLTIHALESRTQRDDAQWLCYWIVFGFLNYLESAALRVVLYYVPHYFTLKLAAIVWLMLPQTRGAEKVYYSALRPLFHQGRAKAQQINANSPTNTTSQFSPSSNRFDTDSVGYSTGVNAGSNTHNPFVGTSAAGGVGSGFEGLHTTTAGSFGRVGGTIVPPASGLPLPENPQGSY